MVDRALNVQNEMTKSLLKLVSSFVLMQIKKYASPALSRSNDLGAIKMAPIIAQNSFLFCNNKVGQSRWYKQKSFWCL